MRTAYLARHEPAGGQADLCCIYSRVLSFGVAVLLVFSARIGALAADAPVAPAPGRVPAPAAHEFLSDTPERLLAVTQGWGATGLDRAASAPGRPGLALQIAGRRFAKGLGHHAPGTIVLSLDGDYEWFDAQVGLQPCGGGGSVVFRVVVDGARRFASGVMRPDDLPKEIHLNVAGATELRLEADDAGDGIECDMANWAEARLTRAAPPARTATEPTVDVAPFARLMTWDPDRQTGTAAKRTEEFPAADLALGHDLRVAADGTVALPVSPRGRACVGLQWLNRCAVKTLTIEFGASAAVPEPADVQVEGWFGESIWQGSWQRLAGELAREGRRLSFRTEVRSPDGGLLRTWKVRWVIPVRGRQVAVRRLTAHTRSRWTTTTFRCERDAAPAAAAVRDAAGGASPKPAISVFNGELLGQARATVPGRGSTRFTVRHSRPSAFGSDPTVVRFGAGAGTYSVAVADLLTNDCVYVPEAGLLVCRADQPVTLAEYRRRIEGRRTILQRVRAQPEQTLAQALARTHHAAQNEGPVLLSLACDNAKYILDRDGTLHFQPGPALASDWQASAGAMRVKFGANTGRVERHLDGGWLPVPVISRAEGGAGLRQRCFVAPRDAPGADPARLNRLAVCVVELTLTNTTTADVPARLALEFLTNARAKTPASLRADARGHLVLAGDRALGRIDAQAVAPLAVNVTAGGLTLAGRLPPGQGARLVVFLGDGVADGAPPDVATLRAATEAYWNAVLTPAAQIETPEPFLNDLLQSSQIRCLIAARNEAAGERVAPWIAAMAYGPLESEAHSVIRGMDFLGHEEFARRGLDYFIERYNAEGFLTTGYTTFGTGWHLWTVGEHWQLSHATNWLRYAAPELARVGRWIVRQTGKTRDQAGSPRAWPEGFTRGLMPPAVLADWNVYAYHFCLNGYYAAALRELGLALQNLGPPEAGSFQRAADALSAATRRAFRETAWRAPVVPLRDGTWRRFAPAQVHTPGRVADFFPGEDAGRTWAYDVELGAHQLVAGGVLEPDDPRVEPMLDALEDEAFLSSGWFDYPAAENERDWFNLGGFAKVQPYYARNAEIYALRDDAKPFLRSYFNALASLVNREVLTFWEHFHHSGAWDKTHETGYFLYQTRTMLVSERGRDLWLAPLIPAAWLRDGASVTVSNAPTRFGRVSYRLASHLAQGWVEAHIVPPQRCIPDTIVLRLRAPDDRPIQGVTVDGQRRATVVPARSTVRLRPGQDTLNLRVRYGQN
jgi:hypothetical protein